MTTRKDTRTTKAAPKKAAPKTSTTAAPSAITTTYAPPKFKPVSDETTPYGAKKFRVPRSKDEFTGFQGSAQLACVLDIDGTLSTWGSGADKKAMEWCAALYKKYPDIVFLIITARDHEYMYETSFNWCMRHFPYAFIGPFCRAADDPRYASEFKRELSQSFEDIGLYQIIAAADDNKEVIDMWKHWKTTHEIGEKFDLLECSYGDYADWRFGLDSKGDWGYYGAGAYTTDTSHKGETWVNGYTDPVTKQHVNGYWVKDPKSESTVIGTPPAAKHRAAGSNRYESLEANPDWKRYLEARYGRPNKAKKDGWPKPGLNIVSESPNEEGDLLDEVISELGSSVALYRQDMEDIVAHAHPDWTPEYMSQLTDADLREECGITNGNYRDGLYGEIIDFMGGTATEAELELFDIEELEAMLEMTRDEITLLLDDRWNSNIDSQRMADAMTQEELDEQKMRRQQRMDLEDLVCEIREDLDLTQVEQMDVKDLEAIAKAALAPGKVSDVVEAHLPPLGDEAQALQMVF